MGIRIQAGVTAALISLGGCKKSRPEMAPAVFDAGIPTRAIPPLPSAAPGPAYALVQGVGLARLDLSGWQVVSADIAGMYGLTATRDGTLWSYGPGGAWRLDGAALQPTPDIGGVTSAAAAPDGSLWAISTGTLKHLEGAAWRPEAIPGDDPPRGVAIDGEGAIWIRTLDRTYRKDAHGWKAIDVPEVTGTTQDSVAIAALPTGEAYLGTEAAVLRADGDRWIILPVRGSASFAGGMWLAPGPAGRVAVTTSGRDVLAGQGDDVLRPLDLTQLALVGHEVTLAMDGASRTWLGGERTIVVVDAAGAVVQRFTGTSTPALAGTVFAIAVVGGGPARLQPGERALGTVTGKLEGQAAGVTVAACTVDELPYTGDPCAGVVGASTAATLAGGRFTMPDVAISPLRFWAKRGGRWRTLTVPAPCCAQLAPDATIDVGTLTF